MTVEVMLIDHIGGFVKTRIDPEELREATLRVSSGEVEVRVQLKSGGYRFPFERESGEATYRQDEGCSALVRQLFGPEGMLRLPEHLRREMVMLPPHGAGEPLVFDVRELFAGMRQVVVVTTRDEVRVQSGARADGLGDIRLTTSAQPGAYRLADDGAQLLLVRLRVLGAQLREDK